MSDAVAMTDKDVLTVEVVGRTVAGCLELLLIAFDKQVSTAITHVNALAVEVGTVDRLAASYCHAVIALRSLAAVIPRHKEVVIAAMLEDEWRFDGVRSGKVGCGVLWRVGIDGQCTLAGLTA